MKKYLQSSCSVRWGGRDRPGGTGRAGPVTPPPDAPGCLCDAGEWAGPGGEGGGEKALSRVCGFCWFCEAPRLQADSWTSFTVGNVFYTENKSLLNVYKCIRGGFRAQHVRGRSWCWCRLIMKSSGLDLTHVSGFWTSVLDVLSYKSSVCACMAILGQTLVVRALLKGLMVQSFSCSSQCPDVMAWWVRPPSWSSHGFPHP